MQPSSRDGCVQCLLNDAVGYYVKIVFKEVGLRSFSMSVNVGPTRVLHVFLKKNIVQYKT